MHVSRQPVLPLEFDKFIEFDRLYLISGSEIPEHDSPPPITHAELNIARERGDEMYWVCTPESNRVGYYWTEQRPPILFISGLVLATPFRGRGIGSIVLKWVEESASNYGLQECGLAVSSFNRHAMHVYNAHGYSIVETKTDYFGFAKPNLSRFIMKKLL